jgi:hypothetical protein
MVGSLQSRFQKARETRKDILERLKNYKATGTFKGEALEKELFDRVRNMRAKEAKRYLTYALSEWTRVALGTVLSFTAKRIAELASLNPEQVRAFLDKVSVEFGAISADYILPAPVNLLHERPVIRYGSDYFCPVPHLLPWCIKPAFEGALKTTPSWNAYQKQRSTYLVSTARRGGPQRIRTQLEALVGDAADQVVRAYNYVMMTNTPVFTLANGGTVILDKTRYSQRALITVTLDFLDIFTADIYQMRDIGVVTSHDLPWCVALTDLRCISEILRRAFEFTHYLRWRLSIIKEPSLSGGKDELNWLAVYLKEGPKMPVVPSGYTGLSFTSYTDDFDAYFLYTEGSRTIQAPRPSQPLPQPMDRLCDAILGEGADNFTELGESLLDLTFDERRQFAQMLVALSFKERKGQKAEFTPWVFPQFRRQSP